MNHSQLRAFHAVALHGGFSKAAEQLGLTQPAISDQVKKLEERYNVLLFHRHKRVVLLTPLGEQLFEITKRKFQLEDQAHDLLSAHQALTKGHLKLASDTPHHVLPLIGRFNKSYEGVSVALSIGNAEEIIAGLLDFNYDLGIVADMPSDDRFHAVSLCKDRLVAFVSKDNELAKVGELSLKDLSKYPLIVREEGSRTRKSVEREFEAAGLQMNIALEVQGREAAREAVAADIGVGIVSEPEFGHDSRLVALSLTDCHATMTESIVCLKEKLTVQTIRAFLECNDIPTNTPPISEGLTL